MPAYGRYKCKFQFGGKDFPWMVVEAKVSKPIVGSDLMGYYGLSLDYKNRQVRNAAGWATPFYGEKLAENEANENIHSIYLTTDQDDGISPFKGAGAICGPEA